MAEYLDINGRPCRIPLNDYRVDWDRKVSGPQKAVKDFLRPYWQFDFVCEEVRIPRKLWRLDLYNVSSGIVVEVSPGEVHNEYNPFFHRSVSGFRASLKRDILKARWCELNGLKCVEVTDDALPLNIEWFKTHYDITL